MKSQFIGKTFVVLGDSITEHGHYIKYLRAYFHEKKEKCYFFNRGTGGNRAVMAPYLLDPEIKELKPDYIGISFGANDIGCWLYDSRKVVTPALIAERKKRDYEFFEGYKSTIRAIKEKGIVPVVFSPFAMDELLFEKEDIETIADNDEKAQNMDADFYTRKTYRNLNNALKIYAERLKEIAIEEDALYLPMFERTYQNMLCTRGLFRDDGLHYSFGDGHKSIAKIILEYLGCEVPLDFPVIEENEELEKLVQNERHGGFIRRGSCSAFYGDIPESVVEEKARECLKETQSQWLLSVGGNYFKYKGKMDQLRLEIKKRTEDL